MAGRHANTVAPTIEPNRDGRRPDSRFFTDAELEAELAKIHRDLAAQGKPTHDPEWRLKATSTDGGVRDVCARCGARYRRMRFGQRFCSERCRTGAKVEAVRDAPVGSNVPCAWCGALMVKTRWHHQYCRSQCVTAADADRKRQRAREDV